MRVAVAASIGLFIVIIGAGAFFRFWLRSKTVESPTHALAMTAIEACPDAVAALGTPVTRADMPSGETGAAVSSWTFSVRGPRGRGLLSYDAEKRHDGWKLTIANLSVGGRGLDLLACAR